MSIFTFITLRNDLVADPARGDIRNREIEKVYQITYIVHEKELSQTNARNQEGYILEDGSGKINHGRAYER